MKSTQYGNQGTVWNAPHPPQNIVEIWWRYFSYVSPSVKLNICAIHTNFMAQRNGQLLCHLVNNFQCWLLERLRMFTVHTIRRYCSAIIQYILRVSCQQSSSYITIWLNSFIHLLLIVARKVLIFFFHVQLTQYARLSFKYCIIQNYEIVVIKKAAHAPYVANGFSAYVCDLYLWRNQNILIWI